MQAVPFLVRQTEPPAIRNTVQFASAVGGVRLSSLVPASDTDVDSSRPRSRGGRPSGRVALQRRLWPSGVEDWPWSNARRTGETACPTVPHRLPSSRQVQKLQAAWKRGGSQEWPPHRWTLPPPTKPESSIIEYGLGLTAAAARLRIGYLCVRMCSVEYCDRRSLCKSLRACM